MCVKVTYGYNCWSLLIISMTKMHDYYFASLYCQFDAEGVTAVSHIVTLNSSGFRGILNGKYDLVIIDVHARK
jgi:hypothetical protein